MVRRARAEVVIARDADHVWATIADFTDPSWIPGVDDFRIVGEHERVLRMTGMELVERELDRDDERRVVTYALVESPLQLEHHEGTITVSPDSAGSRVTWDVATDDHVVDDLRRGYQAVLDALRADLET